MFLTDEFGESDSYNECLNVKFYFRNSPPMNENCPSTKNPAQTACFDLEGKGDDLFYSIEITNDCNRDAEINEIEFFHIYDSS